MRSFFLLALIAVTLTGVSGDSLQLQNIKRVFETYKYPEIILANRSLAYEFINTSIYYRQRDFATAIGIENYIDVALGQNSSTIRLDDYNITQYSEIENVVVLTTHSTHRLTATNDTWIVTDRHSFLFDADGKIFQHDTFTEDLGEWLRLKVGFTPRDPSFKTNYVYGVCFEHEKCGAYKIYDSFEECVYYVSGLRMGDEYSFNQNTVACRLFWSNVAANNPEKYCPLFAPTDGDYCNDANTDESYYYPFFPLEFKPSNYGDADQKEAIDWLFNVYAQSGHGSPPDLQHINKYIKNNIAFRQRGFVKGFGINDFADMVIGQDNPSIYYDTYEIDHYASKGDVVIVISKSLQHSVPGGIYFNVTDRHSFLFKNKKIVQYDAYTEDIGVYLRKVGYVPEDPNVKLGLIYQICDAQEACGAYKVYPNFNTCFAALSSIRMGNEYEFNQNDISCRSFWSNVISSNYQRYCPSFVTTDTVFCNEAYDYDSHYDPFFSENFM